MWEGVYGPCFVMEYLVFFLSSFAFISQRKRQLVALLYLLSDVFGLLLNCGAFFHGAGNWSAVWDCGII